MITPETALVVSFTPLASSNLVVAYTSINEPNEATIAIIKVCIIIVLMLFLTLCILNVLKMACTANQMLYKPFNMESYITLSLIL